MIKLTFNEDDWFLISVATLLIFARDFIKDYAMGFRGGPFLLLRV